MMQQGAAVLVSINASPFWRESNQNVREEMFRAIVTRYGVPAVVVNQVGGNDQLGIRRLQLRDEPRG